VTQATVVQVNHPHAWGAGVGRHMHICFPTLSHDMCMCMHMVAWSVRTYGMRRVRKKLRCGGGCGAGCRGCRGCGGCGAGRLLGLYLELQLLLQLFTLLRPLLLCLQMVCRWCRWGVHRYRYRYRYRYRCRSHGTEVTSCSSTPVLELYTEIGRRGPASPRPAP
jgi:hypothetical protein